MVSTAQRVLESDADFVFSDGHGLARYTSWFDNLDNLDFVDWDVVMAKQWASDTEDMDRQRRKQAEFLIYKFCPWEQIIGIAVINEPAKKRVEAVLKKYPNKLLRVVKVRRNWYY